MSCVSAIRSADDFLFSYSGMPTSSEYSAVPKSEPLEPPPPIEVSAFSLEELKEKTYNFNSETLIGQGSYGRVYFAVLDDGKQVALKKLDSAAESKTNTNFLFQVCMLILIRMLLPSSVFADDGLCRLASKPNFYLYCCFVT